MSTLYHGTTDALIIAPGEQLSTAASGLTTLVRTYQCAGTFGDTAEALLVPGYSPDDFPLLALQTAPVRVNQSGLCTFSCTFYGVLSEAQYSRFYDVASSLIVKTTYSWLDYYYALVSGTGAVANSITQTGAFSYTSPVITRSYVVPLTETVKPVAPTSAQWSTAVIPCNEAPSKSTVPYGLTMPSGQTQPLASDLLAVYGYRTQLNKFTSVPYGSVKLVELEYQKVWSGDGKRISPVYHDPANLVDETVFLSLRPNGADSTLTGVSVSASQPDWDPTDSWHANGCGPVTVTFTGVDTLPAYSIVGYRITATEAGGSVVQPTYDTVTVPTGLAVSLPWWAGQVQPNPGSVSMTVPPGLYTIRVDALDEADEAVATASTTLETKGLPSVPTLLTATTHVLGSGNWQYTLTFKPSSTGGGTAVTSYQVKTGTTALASVSASSLSVSGGVATATFTAAPVAGTYAPTITVAAISAHGTGAATADFPVTLGS